MASAAAAKKCPRLFQFWACSSPSKPEVGLMDQGRGLEGLPGLLLGQLLGGQPPQLVVNQREELLGGPAGRPARSRRGPGSLRSWRTVVPGHPLIPRSRPTPERLCAGSAWLRPP